MTAPGKETPLGARARIVWRAFALIAALAYAAPIGWSAYQKLVVTNEKARERLILQHRLWELQPGFRGRPEVWARMAARLLNDGQILTRVGARYGNQAVEIEIEYRRDVAIARAEIVVVAVALWIAPLAAIYAIVALRRRAPPPLAPKVQPASAMDPRYRPPESS